MRSLLTNGSVYTPADPHATAMAVEDGVLSWIGDDAGADAYADDADEVLDLRGRLVTPAFVDAHVHTVQTGAMLTGLDISGATSLAETLDLVAAHAVSLGPDEVITSQGWDETRWPERRPPTAAELDRAGGGRPVYLSRVDGHSAVISSSLAARVPGLPAQPGYGEEGRVERDAHHAVRDAGETMIGPDQRLAQARAAVARMAQTGIGAFHEIGAPHIGPDWELPLVRQAADEAGLHATLYWGQRDAFDRVDRYGVAGLAGDLNADGAIGSRTAALREPYADAETSGHAYLSPEQIAEHVVACTERGIAAGFHCIGEAALDNIGRGFELAAEKVGVAKLVATRHRLEHVEMPSAEVIATLAKCGVVGSVQPMFDGLWGGPDGMYAERLGERYATMNPFADLERAGVVLAFGSDSPVTELGPWHAIRAAAFHHNPAQRLTVAAALAAHTVGGWRAAGYDDRGVLATGAAATYAVWDVPGIPDLGSPTPVCLRTVVAGRNVYEYEGWQG